METLHQLLINISAGILFILSRTDAKTVVFLSLPHAANVRTHTNVARALTKFGHEAYVLIPKFMLDDNMVNVDGINVISYLESMGNLEDSITAEMLDNFWQFGQPGVYGTISLLKAVRDTVPQILLDKSLLAKLQDIQPDLFILTNAPPFRNIVVLPYMLNISFAYMSPYYDVFGNRIPFSLTATPCQGVGFHTEYFISRLKNVACHMFLIALDYLLVNDSMVAEFAPNRPQISVSEITRQAEIYLAENDHILDVAKPQLPNMKLIGCTAPTPGKPLKDPFKSFVDNSNDGIAVVTFGSSIVNIPEKIAELMSAAFAIQDLSVIWRVNYTSADPGKILNSLWIPQNDILAHPKTKLFVSHCGANGQYEALYHGVPILCLPIFGDQMYNAQRTTAKGFGLDANILEVSVTQLAALMKEVAGNETYRLNIKKASALFKLLYKEPDKTAAFWIDHVLEFGGSYLRSPGQDMPLYQFLTLDVISFLLLILIFSTFIFYGVCQCYCNISYKYCNKRTVTTKNKSD